MAEDDSNPRRPGRPRQPEALSNAERQRRFRAKQKAQRAALVDALRVNLAPFDRAALRQLAEHRGCSESDLASDLLSEAIRTETRRSFRYVTESGKPAEMHTPKQIDLFDSTD